MRRTTIAVGLVFFLYAAAAADEAPPPELAGAVSRLAVAIEHLSVAMDKQATSGNDSRDRERVQVAVEILGLRMRKVERLESGALQLKNEVDDLRNQLAILKTQISESDDERRQEGRELSAEERTMQGNMQRGLAMFEARVKSMEERKSALEAELDTELRGLSTLEAILDDWLKQQR